MRSLLPILIALARVAHADPQPPTIAVANVTSTPQVTALPDAVTDVGFDKLLRVSRDPECARYITKRPIAVLDIKRATPQLHVALHGTDGIVIKLGLAFWASCRDQDGHATIGKTAEGWPAGRYEVYAGNRERTTTASHVELSTFDPDYISPADAAAAPTGPLKLSLGDDLSKPVSIEVKIPSGHPRWYPVTLQTTVKRKVVVVALGGVNAGVGSEARNDRSHVLGARELGRGEWSGTVKPDETLSFDVYGDGGTSVFVVVAEPHVTSFDEHDVFGTPPANARAHDRRLEYHTLFPYLRPVKPYEVTRESAELAGHLFTALDPSLILWVADADHCHGMFEEGEPVILLPNSDILLANGNVVVCPGWEDADLSPKQPAKVVIPKITEPRSSEVNAIWSDEDFLSLADSDKQIAAYKALKDKARTCNAAVWAKLDPDGKADNYDVVTYKGGKPVNIEGAGDRIFRQAYDTCKLSTIEKQRAAIYKRLSTTFKTDEQHRLDAIAKRFAG